MPILAEILQFRTALELRQIASRLGVRTRATITKPDLASAIAAFWLHDPARSSVLNSLTPQAEAALQYLAALRSVPRSVFLAEFGPIRPAHTKGGSQNLPWRTPQSASEELAYAGLLNSSDNRPFPRVQTYFLQPDLEQLVHDFLVSLPATAEAQPFLARAAVTPFCLVHDVAELLAWLQRGRHVEQPLHRERWLPADALRGLNRSLIYPEPAPLPRSHRRTRRLRYLMFWLTAARLQQDGAITPHGWRWLGMPQSEQIQALWHGWQAATDELRAAFDWPDGALPAPWPRSLWQELGALPMAWTAADAAGALLASASLPAAYWAANLDENNSLQQITEELCTGPLAHFGMVTWTPAARGGASYTLTPLGRQLLNEEFSPGDAAQAAQPVPATWRREDDTIVITRQAVAITPALPVLTAAAQRIETRQEAGELTHTYHLSAASVCRSARHGLRLPLLLDALQSLGVAVPPTEMDMLHAWCDLPAAFDVDLVTLLRAPDAQAMAAIQGNTAMAGHMAELLSPTSAIVDLSPADALVLLHKHGIPAGSRQAVRETADLDADFAAVWLAGQLYQQLRMFLPLALPPPHAAMEAAFDALPPGEQAALVAMRDRAVEDLLNLLDGRAFTPPPHPSDPATWRPLLEQAMADQAWLEMLYFSPARNLLTRRHIQPAWFVQQPGPAYLVAYCQEAGAMLTFRLDRIQSLQPLSTPE